jgi:hypothetical protein
MATKRKAVCGFRAAAMLFYFLREHNPNQSCMAAMFVLYCRREKRHVHRPNIKRVFSLKRVDVMLFTYQIFKYSLNNRE